MNETHGGRARTGLGAIALALTLGFTLAGCTQATTTAKPSPSASASASPSSSASTEAEPDATADPESTATAEPGEVKQNTDKLVDPSKAADVCGVFGALSDLNAQIAALSPESAQTRFGDLLRLTGATFARLAEVDDVTELRAGWQKVGESATKAGDSFTVFGGEAMNATTLEALGQLSIDYEEVVGPQLENVQKRCGVDVGSLTPVEKE
ncbi:hypothetical protein D9V32_00250 [Mycetocola tolaasinivorans]|uniref:Uncharacterized protein n=1 Tax=Mycetocola tolaasinivorans TaxID=76635 RepID=A0A3L7AEI1_9MICO|nr:hypothetical protein [Mycetocola tolaasinivorans]RLP77802.1 hypothetical protein D9V32_00250 [Mycetocola tolaasinivorans]